MRTTWVGVPQDLRDAATPLLHEHKRLVPGWVKFLSMKYDDNLADEYANACSEQNYGRASLTFGPGWLNLDSTEREWVVVHELGHIALAPLERAIEQVLEGLPKRLKQLCEKLYEDALEESVSGLAYALVKEGSVE